MKIATLGVLLALALVVAIQNQAWQTQAVQNSAAQDTPAKGAAHPIPSPLIRSIQGPALFHAYCASCHGTDAKGGGPMVASLRVKPTDLTRISARNGGVFPKMRVERIISGEEQPASGHGSSAMPVWGPIFSQVENDRDFGRVRIDNLARYLDSIQQAK